MRTDPRYGIDVYDNGLLAPGKQWTTAAGANQIPDASRVPGSTIAWIDGLLQISNGSVWTPMALYANGTVDLPARFRALIGGNNVGMQNGNVVLRFSPSALVPVTPVNTYYVDINAADDSANGTTVATPKKSIHAAITLANAAGVASQVFIEGTGGKIYPRPNSFHNGTATVTPTVAIRFVGTGGTPIALGAVDQTWTADSGTLWRVTLGNVTQQVIDMVNLDSNGFPTQYTKMATKVDCQNTPGSWFYSGSALSVNRLAADQATNANTRLITSSMAAPQCSTSGNTRYENISFIGGSNSAVRCTGNPTGKVYFGDCSFSYSVTAGADGLQCEDIGLVVAERWRGYKNAKDGMNGHSANASIPALVSVDGWAFENGTDVTNTSCNGPTVHDGGALLDIRGFYGRNYGASCAHINTNTIAAHIGTSALNDYGDVARGGAQPAGTGFVALTGATLYRYACSGFALASGGTLTDLSLTV